ncbi:UPF0149 family protein [Idiomarina xiamenensis]|uniref:YecA family protein n=1 Tax=Idiomarina xiamenensis 10-D-4 TaxID=740709 RepID=K2LCM1_9GAMM|nr:UPF0149 family protein [Idiomarina xiamenensis]EKE87635.1 hypothetical protein A10D4_01035 [Idiomarina xiamenensis 10-D-4]
MSTTQSFNYDRLNELFERYELLSSPAEIHGTLAGLVASGSSIEGEDWLTLMSDLANEGQPFHPELTKTLKNLMQDICAALRDPDLGFQLLLPEDNAPLPERLQALVNWVQSFLVGFGINQQNLANVSSDLREVIDDMVEIAKVDFEVDDGEDAEHAYYEILEYLRVSAIMCFSELGNSQGGDCKTQKTLH